eukprot:1840653-Pyramimonas_sp.AAC.1
MRSGTRVTRHMRLNVVLPTLANCAQDKASRSWPSTCGAHMRLACAAHHVCARRVLSPATQRATPYANSLERRGLPAPARRAD